MFPKNIFKYLYICQLKFLSTIIVVQKIIFLSKFKNKNIAKIKFL